MTTFEPLTNRFAAARDLAAIYGKLSPLRWNGMSEDEWIEMAIQGEIVLVMRDGAAVGAVVFEGIEPTLRASVHLVRWGECPWSEWSLTCRAVCVWFFLCYPRLRRVDALVPASNPAPLKVASAVGFRRVGLIPDELQIDGAYEDVEFWTLHREWLEV